MDILWGYDRSKCFLDFSFGVRVLEFDLFDQEGKVADKTVFDAVKILDDLVFVGAIGLSLQNVYIESLLLSWVDNVNNDIDVELDGLDFIGVVFGLFHDHSQGFSALIA